MSVASFETECLRLQAEAQQGFESSVRQLQVELAGQFAEKLVQVSRAACQGLEAALAKAALAARPPAAALPEVDGEPPAPGSFAEMLSEPAVPVRVGDSTVYVHKPILRLMPFFRALLDGPWSDADAPEVRLPCSAAEFGLLVRRFYTGEPLRSPAASALSCAAALRLAAAADMLMVVGELPELPVLLRNSILTPEDAELAERAAAVLPAELAAELRGRSGAAALRKDVVEEMIKSARTKEAQDAAAAILHAQRGRLDAGGVAAAAGELLANGSAPLVRWAARVARDHLDAEQGTEAFEALASAHRCRFDDEVVRAAHEAYVAHVSRCTRQGSTAALADALELPEARKRACICCDVRYCTNQRYNPFALTSADAALLAAAARAAPPAGRAALGKQLGIQLGADVLAQLLTGDLLAALGSAAGPIVAKLAAAPGYAQKWAPQVTPAWLAALPLVQRRRICAGALVRFLGSLRPEVASLVSSTLA